ncbi:MAG: PACE efflux transporter [Rhizobiaceae bacterium]
MRERIYQTLAYEVIGLAIIAPIVAVIGGFSGHDSLVLLFFVSIACMVWSPVHNTVFDMIDWTASHRVASDRPQSLRIVHAASHELTSVLSTTPVIMFIGDLGMMDALALDLALSVAYTAYAYLFHMAWDIVRPVVSDQDAARPIYH